MSDNSPSWVVLKFGGSSVASVEHWQTIVEQVSRQLDAGRQVCLVLSALKNVSNSLEALLHQAKAGVYQTALEQLRELHLGFASQLGVDLRVPFDRMFQQLQQLCQQIHQQQAIEPRLHAEIVAYGELLSTSIGAGFLQQRLPMVEWFDARNALVADDRRTQDSWHHFTSNQCDYQQDPALTEQLSNYPVVVTQGFIARDYLGHTVLLGREGSDTSAAYFAAKLNAKQLSIWTDVPGIFSTNPRAIAEAKQLKQVSYQQAQQMALFGAKVLHSRSLQPVAEANITVEVKSTLLPQHAGTIISEQPFSQDTLGGVYSVVRSNELFAIKIGELPRNQMLAALLPLGFDLLTDVVDPQGEAWFVVDYINTDQQLTPQALSSHLSLPGHHIIDQQSLITIFYCGADQQLLMSQLATISNSLEHSNGLMIDCSSEGQIKIIADREIASTIYRRCHALWVEQSSSPAFGKRWADFIELS